MIGPKVLCGLVGASVLATPAPAAPCPETGPCTVRMTAAEILETAEQMVLDHHYAEARPLLAALENAPQYKFERRFLLGYLDVETGDLNGAISQFRTILRDDPGQTRVRLELARALMLKGDDLAAEHHLRIAAKDQNLPPEVAATIRFSRGVIRDRKMWHLNFNIGLAPDSNINGATRADTVDVVFGNDTIPLTLNPDARARSGVGRLGDVSAGFRAKLAPKIALLVDGDATIADYDGSAADDITAQVAVGPEYQFDDRTSVSVQALGAERWYGGRTVSRQIGAKLGAQRFFDAGQRIGLQIDVRDTVASFSPLYEGWSLGAYATYERVVARAMIASVSVFGRREWLKADAFSSGEAGFNIGIGGELPHGINAGISGGLSYAGYDAPIPIFSSDDRHDLRLNARAYIGTRAIRVFGFSPSLTYSFQGVDSNYAFYKIDRHRLRFNLARYF